MVKIACLVFLLGTSIVTASRAPFITPCKADDNKCIESSAQAALPYIIKGIPELGVPSADPLKIDSIRADDNNLKLGFRNITIYGANDCKVSKILRNTDKNTIKFDIESKIIGVGQYDIKGKLLFIEVYGDGDFEIKTDKIRFSIEAKLKNVEKNGDKYWKISGFDYKYTLIEKVNVSLTNLFDGDDSKAKIFREVLDISWKEIIGEVGAPIFKQILTNLLDVVNKFFLAVPSNELELA